MHRPSMSRRSDEPFTTSLRVGGALLSAVLVAFLAFGGVRGSTARAVDGDRVKVAAAGDVCGLNCNRTANMILRSAPSLVLMLGDGAYPDGSLTDYQTKYGPFWGRFWATTEPAPGNHEYATDNAAGYRDYFGFSATEPLYRSFDIGGWHIVQYDTEDTTTDQLDWIRQDLEAAGAGCQIAYGHRPRWSSGVNGSDERLAGLWDELVAANVDIVLNGHDHDYERISLGGIRQFVVGTGGESLTGFPGVPVPGSEFRYDTTYGVLILALRANGYSWRFKALGGTVIDSGSGACH